MIKGVKGIKIAKMSGGGAARPPPSASMGKLSLEDDNARKSNANGPSGKQGLEISAVTVAYLRHAEQTQESNLGIAQLIHLSIQGLCKLCFSYNNMLCLFRNCLVRPTLGGGDPRTSSARTLSDRDAVSSRKLRVRRIREFRMEIDVTKVG